MQVDAPERAQEDLALEAAQLALHCRQALRVPVAGALVSGFVTYLLWSLHSHALLIGWSASLCLALCARAAVAWHVLRHPPVGAAIRARSDLMVLLNLAGGIAGGAAAPLFMPGVPLAEQALLTTVLCCWCAGSISTTSTLPRAFYALVIPFMAQVVFAWAVTDVASGGYITALLGVFTAYVLMFGRDSARQVAEGLRARNQNVALVEDLRREREEANAARLHAESASRSKSRFIAAASHDMRQPLHALSLYAAALSQAVDEPRAVGIARNIEAAVDSLDSLFEALLDLSRLDAGVVTPAPRTFRAKTLVERLQNEFRPVAADKGIALHVQSEDLALHTDPVLLERVLRNLLDNAVRYTQSGGVRLECLHGEDGIEIRVMDSGVGIPDTELGRIFEEFYQVGNAARDPARGMGLGLASVRRMVELLGLRISVSSALGRGSVFTVRLPDVASAVPAEATRQPGDGSPPPNLGGKLVLVIEDDPRAREAMTALLVQWGCRTLSAASGPEALRLVDAQERLPDMVLADYRLGEGCTGVQAVQALSERYQGRARIPAVIVTGDSDPARLRDAQSSGLSLLHKPVKEARLRAAIEDQLRIATVD